MTSRGICLANPTAVYDTVHIADNTHVNADHSIIAYISNIVWSFVGSICVLSRLVSFNDDFVAYVVRVGNCLPILTYTILTYWSLFTRLK